MRRPARAATAGGGGAVLVVAGLALILVAALAATPAVAGKDGTTVPNFKLKNLDGKYVELEDLIERKPPIRLRGGAGPEATPVAPARGPVLLDFWATWCKPCLRELPHIDKLRQQYADRGLTVVAVSVDQTRSVSKVKSFVKAHKYGFEVLLDSNQQVLRRLKGITVPYLIIVSPDREVLYIHSGYREGDERQLAQRVAEIMEDHGAVRAGETEGTPVSDEAGRGES